MKRNWKKVAACLLAAAMLSGTGAVTCMAAGIQVTTENGVTLKLDGETLIVSGNGAFSGTAAKLLGEETLSQIKELEIRSGVTEIGDFGFKDLVNLESVSLPESLKSIGGSAFRGCGKLQSITFGSRLTEIGDFAFYQCKSLTEIVIPDSVKTLGVGAFQECTALKAAVIGNGVKNLPIQLFRKCTALEQVTIGTGVEEICEQSFCLCTALTRIEIPENVIKIEKNAFIGCKDPEIVMPKNMEAQTDGSYLKKIKVSQVKLEAKKIRLGLGVKYQIQAEVLPATATDQTLKFKSSDSKVVSVDSKGLLKTKKAGKATITCTARDGSKKQAKLTVIVKNYAASVQILNGKKSMTAGEKLKLSAEVLPENAVSTEVKWSSSNPKIAKVTSKGVVKALRPGKATITCEARYGAGAKSSITITVGPKAPTLEAKAKKRAVQLSWSQPSKASKYSIYWSKQENGKFKRLYMGSKTSYKKSGLTSGKTYYFKVRCGAKIGKKLVSSPFSPVISVTVK